MGHMYEILELVFYENPHRWLLQNFIGHVYKGTHSHERIEDILSDHFLLHINKYYYPKGTHSHERI